MKKFLVFLCALMLVLGTVAVASATPVIFDVDGASDSYVNFTQ